ncbi:hypothetical protein BW687_006580 [Pseudomonas graminis]|uniref:hypothetical protein n=1 Tax=Pseudomonas graminis TaxID=158627 RepID=UPI00234A413A|nr:hypothetical protein [Pseudomonas graminis]MDC6379846.1 hypothetical protein [Pseudomonas graminis]
MTLRDLPLAYEPVLPLAQLESRYSKKLFLAAPRFMVIMALLIFPKRCGVKDEKAVLSRRPLYHLN